MVATALSSVDRSQTIMVIEDDSRLCELLTHRLSSQGYSAIFATSAEDALLRISYGMPDLILLDLKLPAMDGITLLSKLRAHSFVPLIVISGSTNDRDRIQCLEAGADDFVSKPIRFEELVARIKALLRRATEWSPQSEALIVIGSLEMDVSQRWVTVSGRRIRLTPIEFDLLHTLMRNVGNVVSYNDLLRTVWGEAYRGDFSVLRVNISRLRQKIEEDVKQPRVITTRPGEGYRIPQEP